MGRRSKRSILENNCRAQLRESPARFQPGGDLADFKRECEGLVREYFTHGVLDDVETSLRELLGRPGWTMRSRHRAHQGGGSSASPLSRLAPAETPAPALGANTLVFPQFVEAFVRCSLQRYEPQVPEELYEEQRRQEAAHEEWIRQQVEHKKAVSQLTQEQLAVVVS